jgi:hypothetical protein
MHGLLSLSLSPFEGERVPKDGEGAVSRGKAPIPSDYFFTNLCKLHAVIS